MKVNVVIKYEKTLHCFEELDYSALPFNS